MSAWEQHWVRNLQNAGTRTKHKLHHSDQVLRPQQHIGLPHLWLCCTISQSDPALICDTTLKILCLDRAKPGHLLRRLTDVLHAIANHVAASERCRVGRGLAALCTRSHRVKTPLRWYSTIR